MQIIKHGLKKVTDGSIQSRLDRVLMSYRITPHSTTGVAPAELLLGRQPRTRLDLLKPNTAERVEAKQQAQQDSHNKLAKERSLLVGDKVYVKNFGQGQRWLPGVILEVTGPVSFLVRLVDERIVRRHLDHIRSRKNDLIDVEQPAWQEPTYLDLEPPEVQQTTLSEAVVPVGVEQPGAQSMTESSLVTPTPPQSEAVDTRTATTTRPTILSSGSVDTSKSPPGAVKEKTPISRKVYPRRDHQKPHYYGRK